MLISDLVQAKAIHLVVLKVAWSGRVRIRDGLGATVLVHAGGQTVTKYNDGKSRHLSHKSLPLSDWPMPKNLHSIRKSTRPFSRKQVGARRDVAEQPKPSRLLSLSSPTRPTEAALTCNIIWDFAAFAYTRGAGAFIAELRVLQWIIGADFSLSVKCIILLHEVSTSYDGEGSCLGPAACARAWPSWPCSGTGGTAEARPFAVNSFVDTSVGWSAFTLEKPAPIIR